MYLYEYEKYLDKCCAMLVSRERRSPRAGQDRKRRIANGLRLVSLLIRARGAQVSRAARETTLRFIRPVSRPACRALSALRGVAGATPAKKGGCHSMSLDVAECHRCDIVRRIHKLILWNGLNLELRSNITHFLEMCDILDMLFWKPETGDWKLDNHNRVKTSASARI